MSERTTERMVVLLLLMLVIWFFGEYLAAIRYGLFALLLVPIVVYLGSSRWRRMSDEARRLSAALLVTAVLLTL